MEFKNIFTEYDESLEKTLEIDPMGLSIVWTHFGQEIFKNKISSVALDVRSFNINLFNHFIIKNLMSNSSKTISNLFEKDMQIAVEKLTIILENMLIWSWKENQQKWGESKKGLLGTSKAISIWKDKSINLNFTNDISQLELLKRQKTLGVNGRYKGSFINMGFFSSNYDIASYFEKDFYCVESIIKNNSELNNLYMFLMDLFQKEKLDVSDISGELIELFTAAFKNTNTLSKDTKSFWIEKLDFGINEAKLIYDNLDIHKQLTLNDIYDVFHKANQKKASPKLEIILNLEPKLSYLDAVLNYLLFLDGEKIIDISKNSFFMKIKDLSFDKEIEEIKITCGAKERLIELNKVHSIESLVNYHTYIMHERGHNPWIIIDNGIISTTIKKINGKSNIEKKLEKSFSNMPWIHDYYISSVFNIKKGLYI